jgi:hypothetical protein
MQWLTAQTMQHPHCLQTTLLAVLSCPFFPVAEASKRVFFPPFLFSFFLGFRCETMCDVRRRLDLFWRGWCKQAKDSFLLQHQRYHVSVIVNPVRSDVAEFGFTLPRSHVVLSSQMILKGAVKNFTLNSQKAVTS